MTSALGDSPPKPRTHVRLDARLDTVTRQKVDELATRFHRPRAAVLCQIMQWGLSRGQTAPVDRGSLQGPVRHLPLYVASHLYEHVEKAAAVIGLKIAPWLRHMVRQIATTDFPTSWQEAPLLERSHDSRAYRKRFMLRLDAPSERKLEQLVRAFGTSKARIIRQLIAQATPEDFAKSWQKKEAEHAMPPMRQQMRHHQDRR